MNRQYGALDRFRLAAALLVVAIHTSPLAGISPLADFILTRAAARVAVPFFLMVTGFFVLPEYVFDRSRDFGKLKNSIKRTGLLYLVSILLYLPIGLYAGHYQGLTPFSALKMLLVDGTFYHLWYLTAVIWGLAFICLLARFLPIQAVFAIASGLYIVGLGGDSYYGLIAMTPAVKVYDAIFALTSYTRIFQAPLFLLMGAMAKKAEPVKKPLPIFINLFAAMIAEALVLRSAGIQRHDSMYVFLPLCLWFLFQLLLGIKIPSSRKIRKAAAAVYIIHPAMIVAVRLGAKLTGLTGLIVGNSVTFYLTVSFLSLLFALLWLNCFSEQEPVGRAFIELDRAALAHNVELLRSRLPEGCELMPAVKADAYGHGAVTVAKELNRLGVRSFCVATAEEGAELRRAGTRGDILVLGYTPLRQIELVRKNRLIQTVTDFDYAMELNGYGKKLRVHIAVDTGMNRLGERAESEKIFEMFDLKNLRVEAIFTHLCAAGMENGAAEAFTYTQWERFDRLSKKIGERGYALKSHVLNSAGILSHPEFGGDYARPGIALYGAAGESETSSLWPVLSLRAEIAQVKTVRAGENVGYGLAFTAERDMKIAVIAAGYADGIPRALSGKGEVLIRGHRAPIVGMVCMDQFMADITGIEAGVGDLATIIGKDGAEEITADELAAKCATIPNEILSRLGRRLKRVIK